MCLPLCNVPLDPSVLKVKNIGTNLRNLHLIHWFKIKFVIAGNDVELKAQSVERSLIRSCHRQVIFFFFGCHVMFYLRRFFFNNQPLSCKRLRTTELTYMFTISWLCFKTTIRCPVACIETVFLFSMHHFLFESLSLS